MDYYWCFYNCTIGLPTTVPEKHSLPIFMGIIKKLQFYSHYAGQPVLAGTSSYELENFVGAKFYCPHGDGNQHIRIREKNTAVFLCSVICTVSILCGCYTVVQLVSCICYGA